MKHLPRLLLLAAVAGCTGSATPPAAPQLFTLKDLVSLAQEEKPYLADPDGKTVVPMRAVVTPPGLDVYYRSPPFTNAETTNQESAPVLNLLPGLSYGRFTPYLTIEVWANDFGPVWVQPLYTFIAVDENGQPQTDADGKQLGPIAPVVFSVAPPHRFYSPFWRMRVVKVPANDVAALTAHPPMSERDVLNLPYEIDDGQLVVCPIVPDELVLDAPLQRDRETSPTGFAPWMDVILQNEYSADELKTFSAPAFAHHGGVYEGRPVSYLGIGTNLYQELPDATVQSSPIFTFVDLDAHGRPVPIGTTSVAGSVPLFSGLDAHEPGGKPDWIAYWSLYYVVRPTGAQPFYPTIAVGDEPDVFAGARAHFNAPTPSTEVSTLPGVARYATRMALHPSCFTAPLAAGETTQDWAATCGFLDSQDALEANLPRDSFIDTETYILCPLMISPEVGQ